MPASEGGAVPRPRRTPYWTILVLLLAVGGFSLSLPGTSPSAVAPTTAHAGLVPAGLLWTPLTISSYTASPSPAYVSNGTTISVSVTGGQPFTSPAGYSYSYSGLPTGCASANASTLSCVPTATGNFTIILTVTDAGGNVTKNAIALRVQGMTITSFTEAPASVPLGSSAKFSANYAGESGTITWSWTGLPAGCTAPAGKTLTCTPTVAGTFPVTLSGTDTSGAANAKTATFTVTPVRVSTFSVSPSTIYTGESTTFTVSTTGTTGPVTYAYTGLPTASPGCVSANTASLACLARVAGSFPVTVTAKDSAGDISTATTTLTVDPLTVTAFTASPNPTYEFYSTAFAVTALGYEGPVVGGVPTAGYPIYSFTGLPAGCVSANTSRLVCSPSQQGAFTVVVTVSDPTGNSTTKTLALQVNPAVQPDLYVAMNSAVEVLPASESICSTTNNSPFYSSTCYPQAQNPSVVPLPGDVVGMGYGVYTNATNTTCLGSAANTNARVAFGLSTNNGTTFYHTVLIGGVTCQYLNAIEPSFAANAAGDVYGAFILENSSGTPADFGVRTADALGFVISDSSGMTFSSVQTLDGSGNLARPAVAVSGSDVYVVYEDIANSSTAIAGGVLPIAVKFIYSTIGGAPGSWSTPVTLPGMNKTNDWNAMNPSIAVSATGEIAVAYATDRSCVAWSGVPVKSTCLKYGSQIVVVTSSNGATWSTPSVASLGVLSDPVANTTGSFLGETTCYAGPCLSYFFQSSPDTSVTFDGTGSKLYVGWSGTINNTATVLTKLWWRWSAVGVSGSSNNGVSWTGGVVAAPNWGGGATSFTGNTSNYYRAAIGVEGSKLYLSYSEDNETVVTSGVGKAYPGPFDNSLSQWAEAATISGSTAGLTWGSPAPITWVTISTGRLTNFTGNSFTGYTSSLSFSDYGVPLIGYAQAQNPLSTVVSRVGYYAQNYTYATSLTIAALGQPGWSQVIGLTILQSGLPLGTNWSIEFDNQVVTSNATSILVVNIPKGITVFQRLLPLQGGNTWGEQIGQTTVPATAVYYSASTLTLFYSILYYFNETVSPTYSASSCPSTASYCYADWGIYNYIYECLPVPGYTCGSAPAVANHYSYCYYYSQVGCYWLYFDSYNYTYVSGSISETQEETIEELYTYTPAQGNHEVEYMYNYFYCEKIGGGSSCTYSGYSHTPCSAPYTLPQIGTTCALGANVGIWLPGGFTITSSESYYYQYNFASGVPNTPNYYNGTGVGAYNGAYLTGCVSTTECPLGYYDYYYYAIYNPIECYYNYIPRYCDGGGPITVNNPINETEWNLPAVSTGGGGTIPGYPIEVEPQGIPSGTPYQFDLGKTSYSAVSPNAVLISSVPPGVDQLTNGSATGAASGWEYYAAPLTVTIPTDVIVNLTFTSYVNLSAPARAVSIHALNLTAGIAWAVEFNGTVYTSSIPYVNTTARPGYYSVESWAVNSSVGTTEYSPVNAASVNFATSTTYQLSFEPSYRVGASASSGGTIALGSGKAGNGANAYYKSGSTVTVTATAANGYEFLGFTGVGAGSYTGNGTLTGSQYTATVTVNGPIVEGAAFGLLPLERYSITFASKNLPAGVWWTISLGGVQYSSNTPTLTVTGLYTHNAAGGLGTYKFSVADAYGNNSVGTRYVPGQVPASVWANASGTTTYGITWSTQYQVTLTTTPGGTVTGSAGSLRVGTAPFWESANGTVAAIATKDTGYKFLGWNGTGPGSVSGTSGSIQFQVTGPVTEVAVFEKIPYHIPPTYTVEFVLASPVEPGTTWTLTVANTTESWQFSSVASTLNGTGLGNGTYTLKTAIAYGPDGLTRYVAVAPPPTVTVSGQNATVRLLYTTQYWVSIESSALGTASVTQGSSNAAASLSGWYGARTVLVLTANASGNAVFVGWVGNGSSTSGAYTGDSPTQSITVGGPIREVAEFEPPAPATVTSGGFFASTPSWLILAAIGFVVGMVLGIVLFRRRKAGGGGMDRESSSPSVSEFGSGTGGTYGDREASEPSISEVTAGEPMDNPGADQ